jgi:hypothetical protein
VVFNVMSHNFSWIRKYKRDKMSEEIINIQAQIEGNILKI